MFDHAITRRDALRQAASVLAAVSAGQVLPRVLVAADTARVAAPSWPMLHGPDGNFNPTPIGAALVEHLKDARKVWESEYHDIGIGKCSIRTRSAVVSAPNFPDADKHYGGFGSPIVAEDTIFVAHFRPSGEVRIVQFDPRGGNDDAIPEICRTVGADDVVAAIDRTGKTRWVAVQKGKGVNQTMDKRGGWGVTPAYHAGRVFAIGTTGRLYALDAATGKLLWESNVGKAHQVAEKLKTVALDKKVAIDAAEGAAKLRMGAWSASLIIAGGVLVVPDYAPAADIGLRGVSPADGKLLWELSAVSANTATPTIARLDGREYVLCATNAGALHLIDPRDGKVLWTAKDLGPNRRTLTPENGYVVVNIRGRAKGEYGRLAGYRLTPKEATRVWELPDKPEYADGWWPDSGAHRRVLVRNGRAHSFFDPRPEGKDAARLQGHAVVDVKTGEILSYRKVERHLTMPYLVEDRLLYFGDLCHHPAWGRWWLIPEQLKADTPLPEETPFQHLLTSGYEVQLEFPIVAGRIFMRTLQGRIACYDLRRPR